MHFISHRLYRWLNILLIISLLSNLFFPIASALAATSTGDQHSDIDFSSVTGTTIREETTNHQITTANIVEADFSTSGLELSYLKMPLINGEKSERSLPSAQTSPNELVFNGTFDTDISGWFNTNDHHAGNAGALAWDSGGSSPGRLEQYWNNSWTHGWAWQTVQIPVDGIYRLTATHVKDPSHKHPNNWPVQVEINGVSKLAWSTYEEGTKSVDIYLTAGNKELGLYTDGRNYAGNIFGYWDNVSLRLARFLPMDQHLARECPISSCEEKTNKIGGPIDTRSGNYGYQTTDLSIPTLGDPLKFERSYNSLATLTDTVVYSQPLGYGWTHNYDMDLTFEDGPYGEPDTVILKAPHGSRMRFSEVSTGTYEAFPGVWAEMTRQGTTAPYTYVITAANQSVYTFVDGLAYNDPGTKFTASDATASAGFGRRVAMDGNRAVVGAPNDSSGAGAAYVYSWNGTTWTQTDKFSGSAGDNFGTSVDISGDRLIVGAPYDDDNGTDAGTAYVYEWNGTSWGTPVILSGTNAGDYFGDEVAIDGDRLVSIALRELYGEHEEEGVAHIFAWNGTAWVEEASFGDPEGHVITSSFGESVDISGERVVVGAPYEYSVDGAVYVFERITGVWTSTAVIDTPVLGDWGQGIIPEFGYSVALEGDTLVVGAPSADANSAYIYQKNGANWVQQADLGIPGYSVSISGDLVAVGHPYDDAAANNAGAVYLFQRDGNSWSQSEQLTAPDAQADDHFGEGLALNGERILAGAGDEDEEGTNAGAMYAFAGTRDKAHLVSIRDPQGNLTTFDYSGDQLTRVTDPSEQRYLDFSYNTEGLLDTVTDHTGRSVSYGYDGSNRLTVLTDTRDLEWTYSYSGSTNLLYEIREPDPDNRVVERTFYDSQNRAYRQEDGAGALMAEISYVGSTRVVTEAGAVYTDTYNPTGLLIGQLKTSGAGNSDYDFDSNFNRNQVTDGENNVTLYKRDEFGLTHAITQVVSSGPDIVTRFTYDDNRNLETTTDARDNVTTYAYDANNNLKTVTNALNGTTVYTYNTAGQMTAMRDENDNLTQYGYDPTVGNRTVITDAIGSVTTYDYDALGRVITTTEPSPITGLPNGKVTVNQYDGGDNLIQVTENYLAGQPQNYQDEYNLITTFTYDGAGRRETSTDTLGRVTRNFYDAAGRLERTVQNFTGDGTYSPTAPDENINTTYGYDTFGRQITVTDNDGNVTYTQYDAAGRVERTLVNAVDSGSNGYADEVYSPASPDQNIVTAYEYDGNGQVITTTDTLDRLSVTRYDDLNRVERTIANYVDGGYNPTFPDEDIITQYQYDAVGNQRQVIDPLGQATDYQYDALNRVITVTNSLSQTVTYGYDPAGNRTRVTNGADETTFFEYDPLNRLELIRDPLTNETEYRYDRIGNRTAVIDAEEVETRYGYDSLYRLTRVTENYVDGVYTPSLTDEDVSTTYVYDPLGNRTRLIDARSNETVYGYDDLNRRISLTDPENNTTQYGYDRLGNRRVITDANTIVTLFGYDDAQRLTSIDYSDSTPDVTFTYDGLGNRRTMVDGTGTTTYSYDDLNRLTGVNDGASQQVSYGYDGAGNRTRLTYPDERTVTYDYDDANRLDFITTSWSSGQFEYTYDNANRLTDFSRPNGVTSSLGYDVAGRPITLTHQTVTQTLASYSHQLDAVGNRRIITETLLAPVDTLLNAHLESDGQVVLEAEQFEDRVSGTTHNWLTQTAQQGYTGTSYIQALPDIDIPLVVPTEALTDSPTASYPIQFTTPGTYTVWTRSNAPNAAGDSLYVDLNGQLVGVSGGAPNEWGWANEQTPSGDAATLSIETSGVYTLTTSMREDGLRLDRMLLTTDTTYLPTGAGPAESEQQPVAVSSSLTTITRTLVYTYDQLYRLTAADYSTGESFTYAYDPLGNQTAITETLDSTVVTTYTYNAANQLATARADDDGLTWYYTYDDNGNLLRQTPGGTTAAEGETRYSYDAANRLTSVELYMSGSYTLLSEAEYNGVGERVALTTYALGVSQTMSYVVAGGQLLVADDGSQETLYLYGATLFAEYNGAWRYPLRDSSSSVRQTVDESGTVISAQTYKPFGEILQEAGAYESAFGFLGAQLDRVSGLLYAGGRYYDPATGRYLTPNYGQTNPYAPVQGPGMWLLLPLIGIVVAWKGRKNGPWRMIMLICVIGFGVTLVSCRGGGEPTPTPTSIRPPNTYSLSDSRYFYSEQYGWFDRAHLNFANPAAVLQAVKLNRSGGTFFVNDGVGTGASAFLFRAEYEILKPLTDEQINGVTLGILQDFSIEFEHAQLSTLPIAGQGAISTWFANEDLPSNQVGFIAAIQGVSVEEILFDKLGAKPSAGEPPHSGNYPDPSRNFEFRPLLPTGDGNYQHVDFPNECQLQPIDSSSGLWRRNVTQASTGASPRWESWPDGLLLPLTDPRGWPEVQDVTK